MRLILIQLLALSLASVASGQGSSAAVGSIRVYNKGGYVARFSVSFWLGLEFVRHSSGIIYKIPEIIKNFRQFFFTI